MKIAVIGAGVVGTCTAYELALDGHAVTVFDKNASIAEGASFANGCQLAPSLTQTLSHPHWPTGLLAPLHRLLNSANFKSGMSGSDLRWLLRWSRSRPSEAFAASLRASHALLASSLEHMKSLIHDTGITFDQGAGQMLLLGHERDAALLEPKLAALKELGVTYTTLSPDAARLQEPGLNAALPLHSALYFPQDEIGNCRQFSQLIKEESQKLGVRFCMNSQVRRISANPKVEIEFAGDLPTESFDHAVLCTGEDPSGFLGMAKVKGQCAAVQSYSLSMAIREPLNAPRGSVYDLTHRISLTRNGARIRISGAAELGNAKGKKSEKAIRQLYASLQSHFPGAASHQQSAQTWKGSSLFSSDALPLIGPTELPGVHVNMGHGHNGWGMACGSARLVADLIAQKTPLLDATPYSPLRFRS